MSSEDRGKAVAETQPAPPSPTDATRTSASATKQSGGAARADAAADVAATQQRDPKRYRMLGEHGRGGLGRVSRAHDVELGRDVAIKELISRSHVSEVRFLREALITARLEHPGIVPVHEAGRWPDGTPFYAMKLVAGRSLRELIAERNTVDERIGLLHHVIAVADAIAYAHGRHIIHRDLKPANVIVGDFGETMVIDWGLAKDLTASEETLVGGGPFRAAHDDGLTSTGTVLGTPAYMAPEQQRGESVDQRADVYAIGALLWELCVLEKLPPGAAGQRRELLRASSIDRDLLTIVDKALDPDPDRRYGDAGELAADLKAFKAGARIAARRYSPWAMLAHWTRRHRALALAIAIAVLVVAGGSAFYVRSIAVERDRADHLGKSATAALDKLTLKHAELLLTSDPSSALDALASYRGDDIDRQRQIRAEAIGHGAATLRVAPHGDAILWLRGTADGRIVSLSGDGTISETTRNGATRVVVSDVRKRGPVAYAASRHLLAYACNPSDLCLLDIVTGQHVHSPGPSYTPVDLSFSVDGSQLAIISQAGELWILDIPFPRPVTERFHAAIGPAVGVLFLAPDTIVVGRTDGLKVLHPAEGNVLTMLDPDASLWDISPRDHQLVLATETGEGYLVDTADVRITGRTLLCRDRVTGLRTIPGKGIIGFACRDGAIGTWNPADGSVTPRTHLEGQPNSLSVSAAGDYLISTEDHGKLVLIDLQTSIVHVLAGHGFRLTAVAQATGEFPFILSADVRGGVRSWPVPKRVMRVVAEFLLRDAESLIYSRSDRSVIAIARSSGIYAYSAALGVRRVEHTSDTPFASTSADGSRFATYGSSRVVEVWSLSPLSLLASLDTGHPTVSHVEFINQTGELVTSGNDGRLVRWSATGEAHPIHQLDAPIDTFRFVGAGEILVATHDGALWLLRDGGAAKRLRNGERIVDMTVSSSGERVHVACASGDSFTLDTRTWQSTPLLHASETIRGLAASPDDQTVALAGNERAIHVGAPRTTGAAMTWVTLAARARQVTFTRDGLLIAICADGAVWLYSRARQSWLCLLTGSAALSQLVVDEAETTAYVLDSDGRLLAIDLAASRKLFDD